MQTKRLYYDFFSKESFKAEIVDVSIIENCFHVILDRTIFYPEGGGQPADRGSINSIAILDVQEKDGNIIHLLHSDDQAAEKLKPGPAELILDLRRRRDFSQLHTAQHLLSAVILRMTGAATVSMHLGGSHNTIDVDISKIEEEVLLAIEETASDAIEENLAVICHLCPPEDFSQFNLRKQFNNKDNDEVIRVIEIQGQDFSACCGTHVKSTSEIGLLRIYGAEKYKGKSRISFSAGRRLHSDSRILRQNALSVSKSLSVPIYETAKGLIDYINKNKETESRLKTLEEIMRKQKAEALVKNALGKLLISETYSGITINEVIDIGRKAIKQCSCILILASEDEKKIAAFSPDKHTDIKMLIGKVFEKWGEKGGGAEAFFQGSFPTVENMNAFLNEASSIQFLNKEPV